MAKKERLIELLQEKRAAFITRAVTKGLPSTGSGQATPNVPMKDSGVDGSAKSRRIGRFEDLSGSAHFTKRWIPWTCQLNIYSAVERIDIFVSEIHNLTGIDPAFRGVQSSDRSHSELKVRGSC